MPLSRMKQKEIEQLKDKARKLYRAGFSYRAVGDMVGRSYEWVRIAVKKGDWRKKN